jgi:hypothetical protein
LADPLFFGRSNVAEPSLQLLHLLANFHCLFQLILHVSMQ